MRVLLLLVAGSVVVGWLVGRWLRHASAATEALPQPLCANHADVKRPAFMKKEPL
jgi:hypothetical protein